MLAISVPFCAGHGMLEFLRDAVAFVATQVRKAKIIVSSRKLSLEEQTHMKRRHENGSGQLVDGSRRESR